MSASRHYEILDGNEVKYYPAETKRVFLQPKNLAKQIYRYHLKM